MNNLNPTLWRTCRMLAGKTRIKLIRQLHEHPGQNVSAMAKAVSIGVSDASQELRRIQSRGFLQAEHQGLNLLYHFRPDPQVRSAAPILKALHTALSTAAPEGNEKIRSIANGLAHPKRIALIKLLMDSPKSTYALQKEIQTAFNNIQRHIQVLSESGLIRHDNRILHYIKPRHPLAKALIQLLPK